MLNLKVRLKQKWFWITLIPLVFLLIDQIVQLVTMIQATTVGDMLYNSSLMALCLEMIGVLFAVLALIGFPVDLTTEGYGDSARALNYEEPAMNASEQAKLDYEAYVDELVEKAKHAELPTAFAASIEEAKDLYGRDFMSMAEVRLYEATIVPEKHVVSSPDKLGGTD